MYKVLIIDDEEPTREAIRILGDWKGIGAEEVLEAGDGQSGLDLLREQKPDLVLVDMKMPGMDGLAFLRQVEEDYPNLLTIVISGFNDFEYTRQAIRSGAVDYLLKPVNRQDLNQALRKAIGVLEERRRSESDFINRNITLNMSLPKLKEDIYLSVIEGSFKVKNNEAFLGLIQADDPGNRFGAAVVRLMNMEEVLEERFKGERDLLMFAISNVIDEFAEEGFRSFSFANPRKNREIIVIRTVTGGNREDVPFRSIHFMNKVVAALKELFGVVSVAGIGTQCSDVTELAESYALAVEAAGSVDLLKLSGSTVAYQQAAANRSDQEKESHSIAGRVSQIRAAVESGHENQARAIVLDFAKSLADLGSFSLKDADRTTMEFIVRLNDMASECGVPPEKLPWARQGGLREVGLKTDYVNFQQYEDLLCRIMGYYALQIRSGAAVERAFDIGEIKEYIDQHYFEDIKISIFAERYYLSREYLMKLFKQQYGSGIHEYVQKVRMDKAKELLNDSDLKIQDISEMLGYKDKNYFSKAFRNYFALSPSEYRHKWSTGQK
ncbi:response regulator [Cohnella lubricantis]|uniref:Response regulator n=1 Tax=Cohnella lubricantis TaxID=2163172 RepID=A0A841TE80_9BACL|nr:response regulator [Cohnella lubricantis]MBB6679733.1 response regulator [Cohnella lubricantis]MBP2120273.1 two-component system response regulator YesN [Cohnella lubricantis]